MHRGPNRTQRPRVRAPSPQSEVELQRRVKELQRELEKKNRKLEKDARRLEQDFGLTVDPGTNRNLTPPREGYMSPIRVGQLSPDRSYDISSPIRITSPEPYRRMSPTRYDCDRSRSRHSRKSPSPRRNSRRGFQYESISPSRRNERKRIHYERTSPSPLRIERFQYDRTSPSPRRNERNGFQYDMPSSSLRSKKHITTRGEQPTYEIAQEYPSYDRFPDYSEHVEEMHQWPTQRSASPRAGPIAEDLSPLYPPLWKNEENVQIEPMPVFPMDDAQEPVRNTSQLMEGNGQSRDDKVRIQMAMIAEQAERAAKRARQEKREKIFRSKESEREREKAREKVREYQKRALEERREEEIRRRKIDRDRRHEQKKKEDEEERKKKQAKRRREEEEEAKANAKKKTVEDIAEVDERFLKYLSGALGSLKCEASRREERNRNGSLEYKGVCYATNIPKEFVCGQGLSTNKGTAYLRAVTNYMDKLVCLGLLSNSMRDLMPQVPKLPQFLAEFVEGLCDEIAIYGVQISVTNSPDMRLKFEEFAKNRSSKFWSKMENREKLDKFLRNTMGDDALAIVSAIFGSEDRNRNRSEDTSNSSSLAPLQMTSGNSAVIVGPSVIPKTVSPADLLMMSPPNAYSTLNSTPAAAPSGRNLQQPSPVPPPLMSIPMQLPNVFPPQVALLPPPLFQPPMYPPSSLPGFPVPRQPLMGTLQPPQPLYTFPSQRIEDDPDFMDEIFS